MKADTVASNGYVITGKLVRGHVTFPGWWQSRADGIIDVVEDFRISVLRGDPEIDECNGGFCVC